MKITNGIYKYTNKITNEVYIGQSVNLKARYNRHKSNISDDNHQEKFYQNLRKYGLENFSYEILEEFESEEYNPIKLDELEIAYISLYDSYHNGLNSTPGGNIRTNDDKKIPVCQYDLYGNLIDKYESASEASRFIGCVSSLITACCLKQRSQTHNYQWRYASENLAQLEDISNEISHLNIPILKYDLYGNFIKEYSSLEEILIENPTYTKPNITNACLLKNNHSYNFQWRYKNDKTHLIKNIDKRVLQIDKHANIIINEFETASEASKQTNIHRGNIGECLNGSRKTAGGFRWIYKKDYKKEN